MALLSYIISLFLSAPFRILCATRVCRLPFGRALGAACCCSDCLFSLTVLESGECGRCKGELSLVLSGGHEELALPLAKLTVIKAAAVLQMTFFPIPLLTAGTIMSWVAYLLLAFKCVVLLSSEPLVIQIKLSLGGALFDDLSILGIVINLLAIQSLVEFCYFQSSSPHLGALGMVARDRRRGAGRIFWLLYLSAVGPTLCPGRSWTTWNFVRSALIFMTCVILLNHLGRMSMANGRR